MATQAGAVQPGEERGAISRRTYGSIWAEPVAEDSEEHNAQRSDSQCMHNNRIPLSDVDCKRLLMSMQHHTEMGGHGGFACKEEWRTNHWDNTPTPYNMNLATHTSSSTHVSSHPHCIQHIPLCGVEKHQKMQERERGPSIIHSPTLHCMSTKMCTWSLPSSPLTLHAWPALQAE